MATTLTLIRHAKSGWDDPLLDDHDRFLAERGIDAATAMGRHLQSKSIAFDLVVCSDAQRTRQTADLLLAAMNSEAEVVLSPALYLASADQMLAQIACHDARRIAVIGHNPGVGTLANRLASAAPDHPRFRDYPTCAVTQLAFDSAIKAGAGRVAHFIIPADLKH